MDLLNEHTTTLLTVVITSLLAPILLWWLNRKGKRTAELNNVPTIPPANPLAEFALFISIIMKTLDSVEKKLDQLIDKSDSKEG